MKTLIKKKRTISDSDNLVLLFSKNDNLSEFNFTDKELGFINKKCTDNEIVEINQYQRKVFLVNPNKQINSNKYRENCRLIGDKLQIKLNGEKSVMFIDLKHNQEEILLITEGLALANYKFIKHKNNPDRASLETIFLCNRSDKKKILELQQIVDSVFFTRDLINEPFSHLTAIDLANKAQISGNKSGFKSTVYNKKKIKELNMGGLLAVNKGSIDDPTFTIMEWKPKNTKNKSPLILIGKGIVYDTGGLSLKKTANSMDLMKIDMGGAGTVIGAMQAIASNNLPYYVIGLVPATDNRPSGNAYAPGDVITMHDGTTVEVLNTDAEGRLILADALSFAKKYRPELVIDLATLTGAAVSAIGNYGFVSMQKGAFEDHERLKKIGGIVHERLAEFPFWDDYDKLIESDIADIKNIGGPYAGAITAGKFLAHFTDYPFIHIDMPGVYSKSRYGYRGKGATGMGVRLLYEFVKSRCK